MDHSQLAPSEHQRCDPVTAQGIALGKRYLIVQALKGQANPSHPYFHPKACTVTPQALTVSKTTLTPGSLSTQGGGGVL